MCSDKVVIKVTDLGKCYNIYSKPVDRLKQSIGSKVSSLLGKSARAYYREFWALRNLSMEVKKGETVGIIGRNGSGKSTLLQLICGTMTPTTGSIETHGRITALLELGSGFNPEFTGRENVLLNGAILGLSREEIEARFDAIAAFADIGEFIEQPVKFYSSGMVVRLAFAVQAMVDPDILIVDEALAVGDEMFQRKCFRRLEELKNNGSSILFVSHNGQQVIELCNRAMLLEKGEQLLFSNPLTAVRAYHKLIYAAPDNYLQVVQELKELGQGCQNVLVIPTKSAENMIVEPMANNEDKGLSEIDFYEPGMIPQSTEIMPALGARINSIRIFNREGREVNNLLSGKQYSVEIRGTFLEDQEAIRFGYHIRTKTGLRITGMGYPQSNNFFHNVKKGQTYKLIFKIKMDLAPDTYFIGSGIWADKEPVRLHQVLDFIMFRVLPKAEYSGMGYVDLSVGEPEFEIIAP